MTSAIFSAVILDSLNNSKGYDMWISLKIINKMVDTSGIDPEELADRLTMATAEIESIEYLSGFFKTIYTAKLTKVEPHPDADKLTLCKVDTGSETFQVVCGAKNHKEGDIVALATVGTKFSDDFEIKKSKIRGVESSGMLCSEKELGLSEDHGGILIFPEDMKIGVPLSELYPDYVDVRLEIDNKSITHRPDLWGHYGFAREIGALFNLPVKEPVDRSVADSFKNIEKLEIDIKNPQAAPRYSGLVVKNIKIEESPAWLKAMVTSIGMRPISNIVDITNYVMAELGEPMHAFDRDKLRGDKIIVRLAEKGEKLTTLDDKEHELTEEDIVIADREGAIALAGVMGGGNSEIDDKTTQIVLEAANFNPVNIRKTAHRFDSRTEAAARFEKSLSPEITIPALIRCYELIKQVLPEAEAVTEITDAYPVPLGEIEITTSTDYIRKRLGQQIDDDRITSILSSLHFDLTKDGSNLHIKVPHFRATKDISIADDIVEEVGRIFGYDNIAPVAPLVPCVPPLKNEFRLFERQVKNVLTNTCNMTEVMGYSFVGESALNMLNINEDKELRLRNPLSQEQDRLRRNLIPDMVSFIKYNQRYTDCFDIFELGRVYLKEDRKSPELIAENTRAAGAVFMKKPEQPLFYEAKTIVTELLDELKVKKYRLLPATESLPPYAHPGRSMKIEIGGKDAGLIFELHPETSAKMEITGRAAIFDIDLNVVFDTAKNPIKFEELQKFPEVPFEVSVLTDKRAYSGEILDLIKKSNKKYIKDAEVLSVYEGAPVPEGKKSISVKVTFAAKEKTLDSADIEEIQNSVVGSLNKKGFTLR